MNYQEFIQNSDTINEFFGIKKALKKRSDEYKATQEKSKLYTDPKIAERQSAAKIRAKKKAEEAKNKQSYTVDTSNPADNHDVYLYNKTTKSMVKKQKPSSIK